MYIDDLILVTNASRKTTWNINLCLSIYRQFTSQHPNSNKSKIFFPSWFNKRIAKSIFSIMNFKTGSFPFIYLGILISPKRLVVFLFKHLLDKLDKTFSAWNHSKMLAAGKTVLINSSLMSITLYYLFVYLVHDIVLDGSFGRVMAIEVASIL